MMRPGVAFDLPWLSRLGSGMVANGGELEYYKKANGCISNALFSVGHGLFLQLIAQVL